MAEIEPNEVLDVDFWETEEGDLIWDRPSGVIVVGNSRQVSYGLKQYRDRVHLLERLCPRLEKEYPDQWVALASNGTVVAASTMPEMVEKLDRKGLQSNDAAVRFMATTPHRMIL